MKMEVEMSMNLEGSCSCENAGEGGMERKRSGVRCVVQVATKVCCAAVAAAVHCVDYAVATVMRIQSHSHGRDSLADVCIVSCGGGLLQGWGGRVVGGGLGA